VVAEHFRVGPTFLVGDAAHRHPPTGGLGLNTAIGDVANLAWKLAAVLRGQAGDSLLDTYEIERMPVAAHNVEHSLRNAGRHAPVAAALGLRAGMTEEEGWREIGVWASDTPEGARRRTEVGAAIAANAEDYSQLNIEAGFIYEAGALVPDGTSLPPGHDSATEFSPSARPGSHIPHCWLARGGTRVSTVDLIEPDGFTLFTGADAAPWIEAAARANCHTGYPVTVVRVGVGGELTDPDGSWAAVRGTDHTGAVLVRPDRHVAWRAAEAPADPGGALAVALHQVLFSHTPRVRPVDLSGITEAGEALRTGPSRAARLFTDTDDDSGATIATRRVLQ
jgi:2,4-dichlorophenol 6-monooxygenase